jgi:hypothetical protein
LTRIKRSQYGSQCAKSDCFNEVSAEADCRARQKRQNARSLAQYFGMSSLQAMATGLGGGGAGRSHDGGKPNREYIDETHLTISCARAAVHKHNYS